MFKMVRAQLFGVVVRNWLLIFVLVMFTLALRAHFSASSGPSLKQVLSDEYQMGSLDGSLLLAAVLGFSLAALSMAKGYEILRRSRPIATAVLPEEREQEGSAVDGTAEEIRHRYDDLFAENLELRSRMKRMESNLKEFEQVEQMLRKSNISLSKECERLRSEHEACVLKSSSMPVSQAGGKKRTKAKAKAAKSGRKAARNKRK